MGEWGVCIWGYLGGSGEGISSVGRQAGPGRGLSSAWAGFGWQGIWEGVGGGVQVGGYLGEGGQRGLGRVTSLEWVRFWCLARSEALEKALLQPSCSHTYGFSPVCERRWVLRFSRRE